MKEQLTVNKEQYGHGKTVLADMIMSVESLTGDKFRKDRAMQLWANFFEKVGLEYLHNPIIAANRKTHKEADFYLENAKTFVIVKPEKFNEVSYDNFDYSVHDLAKQTKCNAVVCYTDGKFRLADFLNHKERIMNEECEDDGKIYLNNQSILCRCRECGEFFFTTNTGWYGCRNCGFYDGDNTALFCINGDADIREEKPIEIIEVPTEQKTKKNKR